MLAQRASSLAFSDNDIPMTLALGDVNNDDALDLAVGFGERSGSAATRNRVLFNDGRARFTQGDVQYFGSGADRTYAVALADLDNNGSLDFIAATHKERHRIYFAQSGAPPLVFAQAQGGESREYLSLALGDLDGNGTLDAVAGVTNGRLSYLGEVRKRFGVTATTMSLALADLDKDGDLDIVAGNATSQPNHIYYNDGHGSLSDNPLQLGNALSDTWGVAVGDLNGDQWLDIVAGSKRQSAIYLNDGKGGFPVTPTQPLGGANDPTTSVAVGDLNGDSRPDIVVGNDNSFNAVYLNAQGRFPAQPSQRFGSEFESTKALALGDLDRDGDLDLVVANFYAPNVVYFNDGKGAFSTERAVYLGTMNNKTYSVALADFDGDGALDIAAGVWATASDIGMLALDNVIYLNDGQGGFTDGRTVVLTRGKHYTQAVAVGDLNGDGKPDIVFADRYDPNDGTGRLTFLTNRRRGQRTEEQTMHLETTDLITGAQGLSATHQVTYSLAAPNGGCGDAPVLEVSFDGGRAWHPVEESAVSVGQNQDPESRTAPTVAVTGVLSWSLSSDQSDQWRDDLALRTLLTSTVKPCPNRPPGPYQYSIIRQGRVNVPIETPLQVLSGTAPISDVQVYRQALGERLAIRLTDLSGTEVNTDVCGRFDGCGKAPSRVDLNHYDRLFALWPVTETHQWVNLSPLNPASPLAEPPSAALAGQMSAAAPARQAGQADTAALAPQTGQIAASAPATRTRILSVTRASLLFTSAPITLTSGSSSRDDMPRVTTGVVTVRAPGTQTLTISPDNPLLLFNLNVALEWDAHNDPGYVAGLTRDLQRTSDLLYDWTNGQAALGQISLYHDAALRPTANGSNAWLDADVRIHATNRLRPSATQGGIVSAVISDPVKSDIAYGPGAVEIGAAWNRFGDAAAGSLDEDWPRALAHELGHLLFFLDDNYLGLDERGLLTPVSGCSGVMADPYGEDDKWGNGEFHRADAAWQTGCQQTLSQKGAGRPDWATIQAFYPWLQAPTTNTAGPDTLPLRVTQIITEATPLAREATLVVPIFYLLDEATPPNPVQPGVGARAFLYKRGGQRIVDLGRPRLDQVTARGAQVGDTLCVTDPDDNRQGCTTVQERGNQEIVLVALADDWGPEVTVSPEVSISSVNSTTITTTVMVLTLTGVFTTGRYLAAIIPSDAPLTETRRITMTRNGDDFTASLPFTSSVGFIDITTGDSKPCLTIDQKAQTGAESCRITLDLAVGGSPAKIAGTGRLAKIAGTGRLAPVLSTDGQAMLFGQHLDLGGDRLMILQTAVTIPSLPPWATLIGHAYRLAATSNVTLTNTSLSIGYLSNEVPPGEEPFLRIHRWKAGVWQPLTTTLSTTANNAVAAVHEPGLYALLSSTEIQLDGAGWHAFAYPVPDPPARPVREALASLADEAFTLVYGYDSTQEADPWQVYIPDAPAFSDLAELRFGQGYFVHTTITALLQFKGLSPFAEAVSGHVINTPPERLRTSIWPTDSLVSPPAVIYGPIQPSSGVTLTQDMTITAWINDQLCGEGATVPTADGIGYRVKVRSAGEAPWQGCGVPGAVITFSLPPPLMLSTTQPIIWSNSEAISVTISAVIPPTPTISPTPPATPVVSRTPTSTPALSRTPTSPPVDSSTPTSTPAVSRTPTSKPAVLPTETTTPTSTPTPAPPPPSPCTEYLRNGDFEQTRDWQLMTTDSTARYTTLEVHSGRSALQLGLLPTDSGLRRTIATLSSAYQDVYLPPSAQKLTLTLWVKPGTQDSSGDYQRLAILNPGNGRVISELWRKLENQTDWQQLSFDLTAYRGRTVRLYFEVHNDSQRLPDRTWLYVDDISLRDCRRP